MHFDELTPPEQRVLGCLIEKRWTTPDQYPLSLNALRLACNQSTNRDPVTTYDEGTVRQAADRLTRYGLARLASGHSSRATKYRHLAEEGLGLGREELAVLAVLLLRGPQTPGELKARSDRMASIASLSDVERVLSALADRGYVRRLDRRPGQKEDRFEQLLGGAGTPGDAGEAVSAPASVLPVAPTTAAPTVQTATAQADGDLEARVRALEADVAALRAELARLRQAPAQVGSASPTT
ncbi:MAG: YceH family protein [Solirubrobacteraceae bacterium]